MKRPFDSSHVARAGLFIAVGLYAATALHLARSAMAYFALPIVTPMVLINIEMSGFVSHLTWVGPLASGVAFAAVEYGRGRTLLRAGQVTLAAVLLVAGALTALELVGGQKAKSAGSSLVEAKQWTVRGDQAGSTTTRADRHTVRYAWRLMQTTEPTCEVTLEDAPYEAKAPLGAPEADLAPGVQPICPAVTVIAFKGGYPVVVTITRTNGVRTYRAFTERYAPHDASIGSFAGRLGVPTLWAQVAGAATVLVGLLLPLRNLGLARARAKKAWRPAMLEYDGILRFPDGNVRRVAANVSVPAGPVLLHPDTSKAAGAEHYRDGPLELGPAQIAAGTHASVDDEVDRILAGRYWFGAAVLALFATPLVVAAAHGFF